MSDAMVVDATAESHLDMSLDEIAAQRRKTTKPPPRPRAAPNRPFAGGKRGNSSKGAGRRGSFGQKKGGSIRVTVPTSEGRRRLDKFQTIRRKDPEKEWEHDMFLEHYPAPRNHNDTLTKSLSSFASKSIGLSLRTTGVVTISDIPWQVEASDLEGLFKDFPDYNRAELVFDRSGRPTGAAIIHFHKRAASRKFVEKYNGVKLDDQVMTVTEGDNRHDFDDQPKTTPEQIVKVRGRGVTKFKNDNGNQRGNNQRRVVRSGE